MSAEDRWEPRVAAERLAEHHATVLDFVGRVDQAVTTGDVWYLIDKSAALISAVEKLRALAVELREEGTPLAAHLPLIEDYLVRVGGLGYRAIAALHPAPNVTPCCVSGVCDRHNAQNDAAAVTQ